MTYYSEWIQADDFEKTGGGGPASAAVIATGYLEDFMRGPIGAGFIVPSGASAITQQQQANSILQPESPGSDMNHAAGPMVFGLSYGGVLMPGDVSPSIAETWMRSSMYFHPTSISPFAVGMHNWAPAGELVFPPGATGWQWEDLTENVAKASDVVTAELEVTYTPTKGVWKRTGGIDEDISGDVVTEIKALEGEFDSDSLVGLADAFYSDRLLSWGTGPANNGVLVGTMVGTGGDDPDPITLDPIDLTPHLDELGRTALGIHMQFPPSPFLPGDMAEGGKVNYGYDFSPIVHWTFRPPLFRWIYGGATVAPPLRLFPRTDNLGNTPRLQPNTITRQRSNRVTGYL